MNVKITHNMLLDYLDTDATPVEIQDYVSLGGPNVETVTKEGDDYVYDIEVTSNRIDAASAFGFALECAAILPKYGKKAVIKMNPLKEWTFDTIVEGSTHSVDITLKEDDLATRVSAVVLDGITIGPSPQFIQDRLKACGISIINNVVDISNYLMISLGQPNHTFDFDKIGKRRMLIRKSKKGEKITTLDKKEFTLPGEDIVIEDGNDELIDLAGIMGGYTSAVTENTTTVLLFIETYNKFLLRKTSMTTGQRSMAVSYFEKGLDEERIESTLVYGIELLTKYAGARVSSKMYDIYPIKNTPFEISVDLGYVHTITNTKVTSQEVKELIEPLGFLVDAKDQSFAVTVPSYRTKDIEGPADIVEEIARIYGYSNIPSSLHMGEIIEQPLEVQNIFNAQTAIREYLRAIGFNEQFNYSMISEKLINAFKLKKEDHLHISNTISEEIEYMRTSLVPSLTKNVADNKGKQDGFNFFECARTYVIRQNDLPHEEEKLGLVSTKDYSYVKGVLENIFSMFKIKDVIFEPNAQRDFLTEQTSAMIKIDDQIIGYIGLLQQGVSTAVDAQGSIVVAELSLVSLVQHMEKFSKYVQSSKFSKVKRDLTYTSSPEITYADLSSNAFKASPHILSIKVISIFNDKVTVRMEFGYQDKNMNEEEAENELNKVKELALPQQ